MRINKKENKLRLNLSWSSRLVSPEDANAQDSRVPAPPQCLISRGESVYHLYPGCMSLTLGATSPLRFAWGFAISEAAVMSFPMGALGDGDGNDTYEQPWWRPPGEITRRRPPTMATAMVSVIIVADDMISGRQMRPKWLQALHYEGFIHMRVLMLNVVEPVIGLF